MYLSNPLWFETWKTEHPPAEIARRRLPDTGMRQWAAGLETESSLVKWYFLLFFSSTWIKLAHWSPSGLCWKWNEVTSMCQHSESFQLFPLTQQNRLACGVSPIEEQIDHVFHHCTAKSLEFQSAMHVPSQPKSSSLPLNKVHVSDYVTCSIPLQGTEFSEW